MTCVRKDRALEHELDGKEVVQLLDTLDRDQALALLHRVLLCDDERELLITDISVEKRQLVAGGKTIAFNFAANRMTFVEVAGRSRLKDAVMANLSPGEKQFKSDLAEIRFFGGLIASELLSSGQAVSVLAGAIRSTAAGQCPDSDRRFDVYEIIERYKIFTGGIRLLRLWVDMAVSSKTSSQDIIIKLAAFLRYNGQLSAALETTDCLEKNATRFSRPQQSILWTQRAAILLDLYEANRDPRHLESADLCARKSWAIKPSEECSMVFNRLKTF